MTRKARVYLTAARATEIRERRAAGELPADIAAEFNVSRSTVSAVCTGRLHRDAPGPITRKIASRTTPLADRLAAKIDTSDGPDACHPWTGSTDRYGYGKLSFKGTDHQAHKAVLELKLGRGLEPREVTRHTCHNTICCNERHVVPGSHQDNSDDMVAAGRQAVGESSGTAVLSARDVAEIRRLLPAMGHGKFELLGRMFGVTGKEISHIARGARWAATPEPTR